MASNGASITLTLTPSVQGGQASLGTSAKTPVGKVVPSGKVTTVPAESPSNPAASAAVSASGVNATPADAPPGASAVAKTIPPVTQPDLKTLITQLNTHLNDSGRPDQFRIDPHSSKTIQEINPATGAVIGEFAASEFPALARSLGASGLLVDSIA